LPPGPPIRYNNTHDGGWLSPLGLEKVMRRFYFSVWVPFTVNKRRLLVLALASYAAMC